MEMASLGWANIISSPLVSEKHDELILVWHREDDLS
jgi:hypothetical protein